MSPDDIGNLYCGAFALMGAGVGWYIGRKKTKFKKWLAGIIGAACGVLVWIVVGAALLIALSHP